MPRKRTIADQERDAQAVEMRRRHLNYKQIAAQLGYASLSSAYDAVQRGLADARGEASEAVKQIELERLDDIARGFQRVFATRHYVVSVGSGKVVMDPKSPGEPLLDDGPVITAGLALLRVMERRAKYLGLDAPAKTRVEIVPEDAVDAEIKRLEARLADNDRDHSGTSREAPAPS
jgi:hypothetical protein